MLSTIEDLIRQLSLVIINYKETLNGETLTPHNWSSGGWNYITPDQRRSKLKVMVQTLHSQSSSNDIAMLEYFLYVIDSLEPLLESPDSLQDDDINLMLGTLTPFLDTFFEMLNTHQNTVITKTFDNNKPVDLHGFGQWFKFQGEYKRFSDLGNIILDVIVKPFNLKKDTCKQSVLTMISNYRPISIEPLTSEPSVFEEDDPEDPVGWCNVKIKPNPNLKRVYHALGKAGFFAQSELGLNESKEESPAPFNLHFFQPLSKQPKDNHAKAPIELSTRQTPSMRPSITSDKKS